MKISFHRFRVPFRIFFLNLCNDTNINLPRVILHLFDIKAALCKSPLNAKINMNFCGTWHCWIRGAAELQAFTPQERLLEKQEFPLSL